MDMNPQPVGLFSAWGMVLNLLIYDIYIYIWIILVS